jgi:biotin operon repressor
VIRVKKHERLALLVSTLAMRGRISAEHLAEVFGVPDSTVYSDVKTLRRAGIPIHGEPGPGGGFTLRPDHTRADLSLSPRDAVLLLLESGVLLCREPVPTGAAAMRSSLQTALAALPKPLEEFCAAIWQTRFAPPDTPDVTLYADVPELLTNAILAGLPLFLDVGDSRPLLVRPEAVQWSAKGWRLIGRDERTGEPVELDLSNIREAHLDGQPGAGGSSSKAN